MSGPLHGLFGTLPETRSSLEIFSSVALIGMFCAYGLALACIRAVSMRALWIVIGVLAVLLLLTPPLQLTDVFDYLGYARLGALHDLNPYTHVLAAMSRDPVYLFSTWHNLHSPYGELWIVLSYPLGLLPLPVACWILKVTTVAAGVALLWLVGVCARRLGRDPRFSVAFLALNPIFLAYALGGFHNDLFMLVASTAAIAVFLGHRDRTAGALVIVAVAIKFMALLILPFMVVAAWRDGRRWRVLEGALLAAVPLAALSLLLFGPTLPNVVQQTKILTPFSIPNLLGLAFGVGGGTHAVLRDMTVAVAVVTIYQLIRFHRGPRRDWLAGAGWATLALIASASWLMPWYVTWLLPLAALGRSRALRGAALALTLFLILTLSPGTNYLLAIHHISPLHTPTGRASMALQHRLVGGG
jgi:branched-subunit amino acid transport protein AzlD